MVRVITQETFDDVVKENMEEFDMAPEEALKEACEQFQAQGVDLSNIIKELALGSDEVLLVCTAVSKLKELSTQTNVDDDLLKELDILKNECKKDLAHRVRAGKDGAYNILLDLAEAREKMYSEHQKETDKQILIAVLKTLTALMDVQPDLLDHRGMSFIKKLFETAKDEEILTSLLRWSSICCVKHEANRQSMVANNIPKRLNELLKTTKNHKVLTEILQLIRYITLDDDIRVEFGKAHEHARDMGYLMIDTLCQLMRETQSPPLLSDIMSTISSLLVRNELCAAMTCEGRLLQVAADNLHNNHVASKAAKLIIALAGNDDVKRKLMNEGVAELVVTMLDIHMNNETTTALLLKSISALCLRECSHSAIFLSKGAPAAIVAAAGRHRDSSAVQKNACWAIRNMVARFREANAQFLELGAEEILNEAYKKFADDFGFDIKSALRDLDCKVHLEEQWTGKGVQLQYD